MSVCHKTKLRYNQYPTSFDIISANILTTIPVQNSRLLSILACFYPIAKYLLFAENEDDKNNKIQRAKFKYYLDRLLRNKSEIIA